ncbi:glycosyltransferase [Fluviicola taffensis]|uniref:Glycosyl transferase group 1 n=1 Tax=Fluviicola taffensis (strain DSM 16823 / NCIMB 13979 / RW262) TaxID=755732 RepID=F2IIN6_FLUTR|nr:glycosyltransferase [Fluviicola taffensis]AEA45998.1 glycosyl transferase group 1 [Fluviicola taffensis DSM 16823]
MKIVLLSAAYPYRGGISQFNTKLHQELSKENEVVSVTFKRQYPAILFPGKTQLVTEKDQVEVLKTERWLDTINPISYRKTAAKINQLKPDVLITRYWMPFFSPSMGYIAKKMNSKTKRIAIVDNLIPHESRFFDKKLTAYFVRNHDGFIVMSKQVQSDLLLLKPDAKVLLLNHPIYDQFGEKLDRIDACKKLQINPEKKILLFFGLIRDYKGLDILLKTLAKLDDSYHLVVAGEVYGSFENYQKIIDSENLKSKLTLHLHYISDQDVAAYFSAADALMMTYKSATQSGISAIALNFECPSIATSVGGLKEIIKDQVNGRLSASQEPVEIAEIIRNYFSNNQKEGFSKALLEEKLVFSWKYFSEKLRSFIDAL